MARSRRNEERLLTRDEGEAVAATHHPSIQGIADGELLELARRLRERRDRANDIAKRQRREMRGKARDARGGAADDTGTRAKRDVLAAAVQRANKELSRRKARASLKSSARRALEMKRAAGTGPGTANPAEGDRTAGEGMRSIPNEGIAPSGALDAEGHKPVVHRTQLPR